jgi:hypothetical protein
MYGLMIGVLGAPLGYGLRRVVDRLRVPAPIAHAVLAIVAVAGFLLIVRVNETLSDAPGNPAMTNLELGGTIYVVGLIYAYAAVARRRGAPGARDLRS